ncbi:MAG: hypothetical protein GEU87_17520 [Alphaproteobacteria bacterium]|nr:hypothetical protein [Alphaproteobacteria bacterium]
MAYLYPIILLSFSNLFMTLAWYGHLKFKAAPLWAAVMVSWLIALAEYWLAVPANRIGIAVYHPSQLKTIQEVITLIVFVGFSYFWLGEVPTLKTLAGFALIGAGAFLVFNR